MFEFDGRKKTYPIKWDKAIFTAVKHHLYFNSSLLMCRARRPVAGVFFLKGNSPILV